MDIDPTLGRSSTGRALAPALVSAILAGACALSLTARQGKPSARLKGKNIGLLACDNAPDDTARFCAAVAELGAQVARVTTNLSNASSVAEIVETARLLGRLYDAVECQGLPERVVSLISKEAGIPVFDGIACPHHPSAVLAARLDPSLAPEQRRRLVIQALLVDATA